MRRSLTALGLLVLAFTTVTAADADWPLFRGADRTGVSKEKGLLKSWPDNGPPLAWKTEGLGVGYSSVTVVGDKVFTMGDAKQSCYLFGIDRKKGGKLWEAKVGKTGSDGPRCTPASAANWCSRSVRTATCFAKAKTARKCGGRICQRRVRGGNSTSRR